MLRTMDTRSLTHMPEEPHARRLSCPSSETLAYAASDDADQTLRDGVVDHLIGCAWCAEEFRLGRELIAWIEASASCQALQDRQDRDDRQPTVTPPATRHYAAAAAVLAAIAGAIGLGLAGLFHVVR
jgi:hypothetical protein